MKRLILLILLFIPLTSFTQIIINKQYIEVGKNPYGSKKYKQVIDTINITEIQDEYIEIKLNLRIPHRHMLITSEYKGKTTYPGGKNIGDIPLYVSSKKMNVYDGDKLISLRDRIDVLNYFIKYGFEYLETNTRVASGPELKMLPNVNYSFTNYKNKSDIVFKNNNN